MAEPAFTPFEKQLDAVANPIYKAGRTGYAWDPVDEILRPVVGTEKTRCKKATDSGRAANVLTESNDKDIDLYLVFIGPDYSRERFLKAAEDRIKRFPNVRTIAMADRAHGTGKWRVRSLLERRGVGLAEHIAPHFPAVKPSDIHYIDADFDALDSISTGATDVPTVVDPEDFREAMSEVEAELDGLDKLPRRFVDHAKRAGVVVGLSDATDLLAAVLSSQFVLFAGPSGTGKSTLARQLQSFFADSDKARTVDARRQWLSPEDLAGYYSVLGASVRDDVGDSEAP